MTRILVLGGTRFLGPPIVRQLLDAGHEVTIFHRGGTEPCAAADAEHVHGDFAAFAEHLPVLIRRRPEVVLDVVPYLDKAGHGVSHFIGIAERAVVVTSGDVYRAFAIAWGRETGDPGASPLREDAPVRAEPSPDLTPDIDYDNIEVERALLYRLELPVTVLRLPMIYGPGDPQHRLFPYVRRMDDRRPAILNDEARASLRWSRGYVENVAAAVALAVDDPRSAGRVFNVAAPETPSEVEWVRLIGAACGWHGDVVVVPSSSLPATVRSPLNIRQDLMLSSERLRTDLGYSEPVLPDAALRRTIAWERENPPPARSFDYEAEDAVLRAVAARIG